MAMKLKDRVAVLTGAGRGIGRAVALAYAQEDASLVLAARTTSELEATAADVRGLGRPCLAVPCDVAQEDQVQALVDRALKEFGRIDVLVSNAGVMTSPAPLAELEIRKWDYTLNVNLRGTFLCARAVLPSMLRQRGGSIITVSSMMGHGIYPRHGAYVVSKWGVETLTRVLAEEVRGSGVRVNAVDPGVVATRMTHFSGSKPESVTGVFLYLASEDSKKVTGQVLSAQEWRRRG
ncbi:MAG: SDR family oxidoreductase [Deltaproteobacteria bacterium]|nr:SDR family oxidoreductase [Deltaproteobacteria bacterium]